MLEKDLCIQFYTRYKALHFYKQFKKKVILFHIPNERKSKIQHYNQLKMMGVLSGVPDYCALIEGGDVAFIEFKRDKKSKLSSPQEAFKTTCEELKIPYLKTCSVDEAINFLQSL